MDQDEESKKRAGDSAVALTKTGIGIGATALFGPIGGIAAAALAQLAGHAVGLLKEKRAKRIDKLHEELLNGVAEENVPRLLASLRADEEARAHYASILEMVYQDDEEEKVPLYAALLRDLASVPAGATRGRHLERHLIRSLRELVAYDVDILRKLVDLDREFPAKPAPAEPAGDGMVRLLDGEDQKKASENFVKHEQFIGSLSPLEAAGLRRLETTGLVQRATVMGGSRYDVTMIGKRMLSAVGGDW